MKECCMSCKYGKVLCNTIMECQKGSKPTYRVADAYDKICDWYRTPKGDKRTTPTAEEIYWMKKIAEAYLGRG